ncbi:uncharacterized protein LOC123910136 [Trifolium pratense]|uniref:uncharacterized protein LOC123910136 n=1 Tax=Trifolium pratense TaxID=57577 RepID=UPI001E693AA1|nr:uncharacterized protein LOC123910136 [Trifolium pratense]
MSSDFYTVDISFNQHSTTDIISYDPFNFLDVVQDDFNNSFFSSFSPPTTNHVMPLTNGTNNELEIASKLMQRSYSCNNFHDKPPGFPFEPCHSTLMNSENFRPCELSSSENSFFNGQMRRACSAGDWQNMKATNTHGSQTEEANLFKVGRYSAEERKEKISKYRAKRKQRKFNKIIKYACPKTLADNRTRIRGRFARNDNETNDIPKAVCSNTEQYHEDEFWVDLIEGLNDELLY